MPPQQTGARVLVTKEEERAQVEAQVVAQDLVFQEAKGAQSSRPTPFRRLPETEEARFKRLAPRIQKITSRA